MTKLSGIYKIENLVNGHCYIGQSVDLKTRKGQHFNYLLKNKHKNKYLQRAYDLHGKENFVFEILLLCETFELTYYEQKYVDILSPEYNLHKECVTSSLGYKYSDESKAKISRNHADVSGDKNPLFGIGHTEETKKRLSEIRFGKKHSEETKKKISDKTSGENNPMFGTHRTGDKNPMYEKHHSDDAKNKMSSSKKGKSSWNKGVEMRCESKEKISKAKLGKKNLNSSSQYIGVSLIKSDGKFLSMFYLPTKKQICIGRFQTEIEATLAYNEYASEYLGWKAKLNVITEEEYQKIWED
jgi:group I intron endonuclease